VRRRLLFSTLAVAVTAVVLFGLPLAFVLIRLQTNAAHQLVQRDATTVARTLENRLRSGLPPDPIDAADAAHSLPDRFVSISRDGGPLVTFGGPPGTGDVITARAVTKNFRVTVVADDSVATEGVTEALVVTGSLAVLAVVVAVALAMFQARRLARPMQELAGAADRLGSAQGLYVFGSPLVGERRFAAGFKVDAHRIVHHRDIVARVPVFGGFDRPGMGLGDYVHVGALKFIDGDGRLRDGAGGTESIQGLTREAVRALFTLPSQGRLAALLGIGRGPFDDHAPLYYTLRCWNCYVDSLPPPVTQ